jgi:hypothetical protein
MPENEITRRQALRSAAAGAALHLCTRGATAAAAAETPPELKILEPFSGAVLNRRHGTQTGDSLAIRVGGRARPGDRVAVNGVPCRREGSRFETVVALRGHENELIAVAEGGGRRCEDRARVVWDRYSEPRYRFSIDDNSFFLRDVAQKNYRSLFDCFYLKGLRELNRKYGTKFTLNIYYVAADDAKFPTGADFRLPQFPRRYQGEWRDNAHWLKLAFHAYANMPDRPYQAAPPEKLIADLDLVAAEIHRFAGPQTYAPPTVIHWAMTPRSALGPLFERGVRVLTGGFWRTNGKWDINYCWDDVVSEYCSRHNAWKDFQSGIVFSLNTLCCNLVPVARTVAALESRVADPNTAEIMDIFTHEQYFWPFYFHYIPDHFQRLDTALRWVTEHGYRPVFYHEGFLGGRA